MANRKWGVWHEDDQAWHATLVERHERWSQRLTQQEEDESNPRTQVPRRIHQIWLGPREIPPKCRAWMQTFPAKHASWEYRLWTDEEAKEMFPLRNQKAFDEAKNYGEKSDILRYEILLKHGGVYADVDVECLQPFDALAKTCSFAVGISNTAAFELNNGVMVSVPCHRILHELIERIFTQSHKPQLDAGMLALIAQMSGDGNGLKQLMASGASDSPFGTIERTGPGLLTRTFMDAIGWHSESHAKAGFLDEAQSESVVALPTEFFYPLRNDAHHMRLSEIPTAALTVHYWGRTWGVECNGGI